MDALGRTLVTIHSDRTQSIVTCKAGKSEVAKYAKEYDFSRGKRGAVISSAGKISITIMLDDEVIEAFRDKAERAGRGYQTLINEALRASLGGRPTRAADRDTRKRSGNACVPDALSSAHLPQNDISMLVSAAAFAAERHRNQRRKDADASPYINHPLALANVLASEAGIIDVSTIAAALLHDTVEDTDTTAEELRRLFGDEVAANVLQVTDDK